MSKPQGKCVWLFVAEVHGDWDSPLKVWQPGCVEWKSCLLVRHECPYCGRETEMKEPTDA